MKVLIGYSSKEGQTRKIARYVADRLADNGNAIELLRLEDASDIELTRFDRVILASPIHAGHYHRSFSEFAADKAAQLNSMPTLLLSVSLAAAGHDAEDWKGLDQIAADLKEATAWTPSVVEQVPGAYKPSEYDIFRRLIMRRIVGAKDPDANLDMDKEYTDWKMLDACIDSWMSS